MKGFSGLVRAALLIRVAAAGPTGPACSDSSTQKFTVNYGFETVERGVDGLAVSNIGVYNLLNFNMDWLETDPDHDGNHLGIAPKTYPSVAGFSQNTNLFTGSPNISISYAESTISSFTPLSTWYGCVYPTFETAGSLPENCTITATGLNAAGGTVASQSFSFATNGSVVQNMNFVQFNSKFANIATLRFSVTNFSSTVGILDNFVATLAQPACAPENVPGSY